MAKLARFPDSEPAFYFCATFSSFLSLSFLTLYQIRIYIYNATNISVLFYALPLTSRPFPLTLDEMRGHLPHPVTPGGAATPVSDAYEVKRGKKRGNYNCGRCGQPKKGHSCNLPRATGTVLTTPTPTQSIDSTTSSVAISSPLSTARPMLLPPPSRQTGSNLRRALSFDDDDDIEESEAPELDEQFELEMEMESDLCGLGNLNMICLWEILKRLPPPALLSASGVCKGWRETAKRVWKAAEELRLRVPAKTQIGCVGSVLQKCLGLVKLSVRMER